jgi:hypothetical protein
MPATLAANPIYSKPAFAPLAQLTPGVSEYALIANAFSSNSQYQLSTSSTSCLTLSGELSIPSNSTVTVGSNWTMQGTNALLGIHSARQQGSLNSSVIVDPSLPTDRIIIRTGNGTRQEVEWNTTTTSSSVTVDASKITFTQNLNGDLVITGWTPEIAAALAKANKRAAHQMKLKANLGVIIRKRRALTDLPKPIAEELKARDTLRDVLTEREWRRYITNGFIMVRGSSGKWYQIFAQGYQTQVYEHGKYLSSICIHTDSVCPPSDHVLNMKVMIEIDEEAIWKGGRIYQRAA